MSPEDLCAALLQARRNRQPLMVSAACVAAVPDVAAACAVQQASGVALGAWSAHQMPQFWKSGAGSRSATLTHAPLMPHGVRTSQVARPAVFDDVHFFNPGVESEIALRLGRNVTPADAQAMVHDALPHGLVDAMAVSIEVVDCRWVEDGQLPPLLRLADFQSHGALVLGEWTPWREIDWSRQRCALQVDAAPPLQRTGSHPLGTPQWLLPIWLRHLTRHGAVVPAGTVVTTGTWTGFTPVQRGSTVSVSFEGVGEAALLL